MNNKLKKILITIISYLYVFLFVYAAISKILDFETFMVQLGQSPLLSAYAEWISILVPIIEIVISILLLVPKIRYIGLFLAFGLMVMFSTYIIIILNYSDFIPCSCGGVLSEMDWNEHLIFNFTFVAIGGIGIILDTYLKFSLKKQLVQLVSTCLFCTFSVVGLYLLSENEMHRNNSFVRRYPHHPVEDLKGIPLKYNSYYIAGFDKGKIILGNSTAPLHLLEIDTTLKSIKEVKITISDIKNFQFSSIQLKIKSPNFYLVDGSIPIIYKGVTSNWNAKILTTKSSNFSLLEPITPIDFIIRGSHSKSGEHIIGQLSKSNNYKIIETNNILEKRIDGIFDTDGLLLYNEQLNKIIYTYYYRNQFIITDAQLNKTKTIKTIDTVSQSNLEFAYTKENTEKKLANQPNTINIYAATSGKYIFIKSDRLGKYESEIIAKQASIIDVYDIEKGTYEFSFYFYHYNNEEIKTFKIYNNLLIGLTNRHLVITKLKPKYFKIK